MDEMTDESKKISPSSEDNVASDVTQPSDEAKKLIADETEEKKLRKQARKLISEACKLHKRGKKHLTQERETEILTAIKKLEDALDDSAYSCENDYNALKTIVEKRLSFAKKSSFQEAVESLLIALFCALFLRTFLVEPFKIPSRSMVPTLLEGDQLFVTKLSYGIRLPFYDDYIARFSSPERGDVIVFAFPNKEAAEHLISTNSSCMSLDSLSEEKDYIKRVIGVEGDTIEVLDQVIHVNGEPVAQHPVYERTVSDYLYLTDSRKEAWNRETIDGKSFMTITHQVPNNHFGPVRVMPGHVFVMGDNRDNSLDSRCWGQVPIKNIKGRAQIIWWSYGHYAPRWERMFTRIH